jgi:hypothetical protein
MAYRGGIADLGNPRQQENRQAEEKIGEVETMGESGRNGIKAGEEALPWRGLGR